MTVKSMSIALLVSLLGAAPALASNEMILLNPDDLSSRAVFNIEGNYNRLVIEQTAPAHGAGNNVSVKIVGDRNGGPENSVFTGIAAKNGLAPGHLVQRGFGNSVELEVQGSDNLFAVAQLGNNNMVRGYVIGIGNQSSISQTGNGNFASFAQNGIGNMISVRQISW